ncbi:MAG: alanine dehydrogenase [Alphaproteobacteria bacterium]|nr:alanine dehydrogenase [Alphaproteobacteria bacterium]
MRIGVPKEIKVEEHRVGLTPSSVRELTRRGHDVLVERGAGQDIGLGDELYKISGAGIVDSPAEIFARADLVVKVKEPQAPELKLLRREQVLFTYLHLAPDPAQTKGLIESGVIAIAYETVTDARGGLPLLAPMSEVAGRMAVQAGAHCLEITQGGRGMLLGGVPGVPAARVAILGGGVVGSNALMMAVGMGTRPTVIDRSLERLAELDAQYGGRISTLYSTHDAIEDAVLNADLTIGAVLVAGAAAAQLVSRSLVARMKKGSVIVDVAIDQGGCVETARPTTHRQPTYQVDGVVHYCVANMPGAVARTSTFALNNATLPFVLALAEKGWRRALREDPHLLNGLNVAHGHVTYPAVARDQGLPLRAAAALVGD